MNRYAVGTPIRVLALAICLACSAASAEGAIIDFTSGTFECSTAVMDPIYSYSDQGVVITRNFLAGRSLGSHYPVEGFVACAPGSAFEYYPGLPWREGITSYVGSLSISSATEILSIETGGMSDPDQDGWANLYAIAAGFGGGLCPAFESCNYPDLAVKLLPGETTLDFSGLGWNDVVIYGSYGSNFPFRVTRIETVPEPTLAMLIGLGIAGYIVRRRRTHDPRR